MGGWLITGSILVFAMVVIGGITRLTGSGLSMVDWNPIMGVIPPIGHDAWQGAFAKYQQSPQFKLVNYQFSLADFKSIFWWEYIHRLMGRLIGLAFIIPFVFFVIKRWLSRSLVQKCIVMFLLGGLQGLLGWYMVKSGLVNNPNVSHFRLATHLVTATILFGYILWVALDVLWPNTHKVHGIIAVRRMARGLLLLLLIQIIFGAFVAGLNAGFVYNTFPKMGSQWVAEGVTALTPIWKNFVEGLAGVQFAHRYLAYAVVFLAIVIAFRSYRLTLGKSQFWSLSLLLCLVVVQFILGVFTLLYSVPITLGVMHQAFGFLLFGSVVVFNHRIANA